MKLRKIITNKATWICVGTVVSTGVVIGLIIGILAWAIRADMKAVEKHTETRIYELVDKSTEIRTHRYPVIENAIGTDCILIWKRSDGKIITTEVGRNSYHQYQIGRRYKFSIDTRRPDAMQIQARCR